LTLQEVRYPESLRLFEKSTEKFQSEPRLRK
jgi:hypothetical protein